MKVPGFLLKRLYVKGSLKNTPEGFALTLKNTLGSGYAQAMLPLKVDGEDLPLGDSYFFLDGRPIPFTDVSRDRPFTLGLHRETKMLVKGRTLPAGAHRVGIGFTVVGLGDLSFEIVDEVAA